jgi:MFS family permease
MMAVFGTTDVLSSVAIGKVSDIIGKRPIIAIGGVLSIVATSMVYIANRITEAAATELSSSSSSSLSSLGTPAKSIVLLACAALVLGVLDAIVNTQTYASIGILFPKDQTAAFGGFRVIQAATTGVWFAIGSRIPLFAMALLVACLAVVFVVDYLLLDRFVAPLDHWRQPKVDTTAATATTTLEEQGISLVTVEEQP